MARLGDTRSSAAQSREGRSARGVPRLLSIGRLSRYGLVGIGGLGLVTLLFWVLHSRIGLHYLVAGVLANEAAVLSNYLLNNNWTFGDRRSGIICLSGLARYHAVSFSGILVHTGTLFVIVGFLAVQPLIAAAVAAGASALWSFTFNVLWTWRHPRGAGVRVRRPAGRPGLTQPESLSVPAARAAQAP